MEISQDSHEKKTKLIMHIETKNVVKDVAKNANDVVKEKANVTKEFAKAQRQNL